MFTRNKFASLPSSPPSFSFYFLILGIFVSACLSDFSSSQEVSFSDGCKCTFPNKSTIDISSLGLRNHKPRWLEIKPTTTSDLSEYSYNPCYNFNLGSNAACQNVGVCQKHGNDEYYNCGDKARFVWNATRNHLQVIYRSSTGQVRETTVNLVCSPEMWEPQLEVIGEGSLPRHYEMTLKSRCACVDLCRESRLSTGSVLVILFMIFTALYLVLGIIHSSLTRGAHGWELIPHYEFWSDFPLLVRDGCVFVVSGCKADTAYERI